MSIQSQINTGEDGDVVGWLVVGWLAGCRGGKFGTDRYRLLRRRNVMAVMAVHGVTRRSRGGNAIVFATGFQFRLVLRGTLPRFWRSANIDAAKNDGLHSVATIKRGKDFGWLKRESSHHGAGR